MKTGINLSKTLDALLQDEDLDVDMMKEAFEGLLPRISDYLNGVGYDPDGASLILRERKEQIEKHGWNLENDQDYSNEELLKAAMFCIDQKRFEWPFFWTEEHRFKIFTKSRIDQLKVAGALIAAEIDRLKWLEGKEADNA